MGLFLAIYSIPQPLSSTQSHWFRWIKLFQFDPYIHNWWRPGPDHGAQWTPAGSRRTWLKDVSRDATTWIEGLQKGRTTSPLCVREIGVIDEFLSCGILSCRRLYQEGIVQIGSEKRFPFIHGILGELSMLGIPTGSLFEVAHTFPVLLCYRRGATAYSVLDPRCDIDTGRILDFPPWLSRESHRQE